MHLPRKNQLVFHQKLMITTTVVISNMVAITLLECSIQLNPTTKMLTVLIITNVKLLISKGIVR